MGCRSTKAAAPEVRGAGRFPPRDTHPTRTSSAAIAAAREANVAEPSAAEKRARAADAAAARQRDWRQGGHVDPEKARSAAQRREKDELLSRIYSRYVALGKEAPIGLPSCDMEQLRRHLETLR
ncbi:unnamed protein product [Hyaloperonospora brassicae]|uniref:RxLR effector candidate protein n=1 Tax=Hyaloperonospora brassicae TaxID=162125 RepID=A0AAV0TRV3_HYABA|nr:unnamed protein product [Hyaloperonospora brassicae]